MYDLFNNYNIIYDIIKSLLDLSKFNVGILRDKKGNVCSYMIQKKGLGLKIDTK